MADFVGGWIESIGAIAVAILMFVENVFPPIPSELVMPLAGYHAASGETSIIAVIFWGSLGSLAGAYLWYWIGQRLGAERVRRWAEKHGRWLTVTPEEVDHARDWFDRHGGKAVLIGRLVPTVRTLISVPAGIAGMPLGRFLIYSAIGTLFWTAALAYAGYVLGERFSVVSDWLNPVSTAILVGLAALYIWRVATYSRRNGGAAESRR